MCTEKKAQGIINEIDNAIFDIHQKFGTSRTFGHSFILNDVTGDVTGINIKIPAGPDISPQIPADIKGWHPARVEKKLLPLLRSAAGN